MVMRSVGVLFAACVLSTVAAAQAARAPMCLCKFVAPTYSRFERTARLQGTVSIRVRYNSDGVPTIADVPAPLLGLDAPLWRSALDAVKQWRFCRTDARVHEVTVTFNFRLKDGAPSEVDEWSPTEVSFEPPATVTVTATAARVMAH